MQQRRTPWACRWITPQRVTPALFRATVGPSQTIPEPIPNASLATCLWRRYALLRSRCTPFGGLRSCLMATSSVSYADRATCSRMLGLGAGVRCCCCCARTSSSIGHHGVRHVQPVSALLDLSPGNDWLYTGHEPHNSQRSLYLRSSVLTSCHTQSDTVGPGDDRQWSYSLQRLYVQRQVVLRRRLGHPLHKRQSGRPLAGRSVVLLSRRVRCLAVALER